MLAWFMTLLVLAAGISRFGLHWVARGVMLCCVVGIVTDWRHVPYGASIPAIMSWRKNSTARRPERQWFFLKTRYPGNLR